MLPRFVVDYVFESRGADSELRAQLFVHVFSFYVSASNFSNLILRQFGFPMLFSRVRSALLFGVGHVFLVTAYKQVLRVYALRIVAFVANVLYALKLSKVKEPRGTRSFHESSVDPKLSVPVFIFRADEWPALVVAFLFDFLPKSFFSRAVLPSFVRSGAAMLRPSAFALSRSCLSALASHYRRCFTELVHCGIVLNRLGIATINLLRRQVV